MIDNYKFIGIITDVIDEHSFIFRSDNNVKCQVEQIVGLNIIDNIYVFANIETIDVNYFLTNSEEYFTSLASDNKLNELSTGVRSPKYSNKITATCIGVYEYIEDHKHFVEANCSVNSYTPNIFQEVVIFDFNKIETIYGLKQNTENYFKLGKFLYPNYFDSNILPDVNISTDTFNSHTLISGVTGSGKSRLTTLIANQLASKGGHITIIDPHDEYLNFADTNTARVSFFSNNEQLHKDRNNVYKRKLSLTNKYLTPQIFAKLLPNLSESQNEYIYGVYKDVTKKNKDLNLKKIIDATIQKFNSDYQEEGHPIDTLAKAQQYAKEDVNYLPFISRYVYFLNKEWYTGKSKPAKAEVAFSLLKRLITVFEDDIFPNNSNFPLPSWLDIEERKSINIINVDYDANPYVRRFVDTIIQCFLTPQIKVDSSKQRILIVDEAHLLLNEKFNGKDNEKFDTAILLSRLLRESRKFGLSIIFITQNEEDVPTEIRSQFQNKFKFREENNQALKYLDNQTCMCTIYKGKLTFPMRVDDVEPV